MDPQKLPTDNLYKFLALAGLALFMFACWTVWHSLDAVWPHYDRMNDQLAEAETALRTAQAESQRAKETTNIQTFNQLKEEVEAARRNTKPGEALRLPEPTIAQLVEQYDNLQRSHQLLDDAKAHFSVVKAGSVQAKQAFRSYEREMTRAEILQKSMIAVAVSGALIAAMGFLLWYYRLQRHLDTAVARQANTMIPQLGSDKE